MSIPQYEPPRPGGGAAGVLTCPKCHGDMRTYERNGIHLEQCGNCRGIFLDFGELESLTQLESRFAQQAPPQYQGSYGHGPSWGQHGGHKYHRGGFGRLFFSS
jgi:uncharacterized protein